MISGEGNCPSVAESGGSPPAAAKSEGSRVLDRDAINPLEVIFRLGVLHVRLHATEPEMAQLVADAADLIGQYYARLYDVRSPVVAAALQIAPASGSEAEGDEGNPATDEQHDL